MHGRDEEHAHIMASMYPLVAEPLGRCDSSIIYKPSRVHLQVSRIHAVSLSGSQQPSPLRGSTCL